MDLDQQRIEASINESLGVRHIRQQIAAAESELEQAYKALGDLPRSIRNEMLERHEQRLEALLQREVELVAQARRAAEGELKREQVHNLRLEAAPLLERSAKCLEIVCEHLERALRIEADAARCGGSVFTERVDRSLIAALVPAMEFDETRGTWSLKRRPVTASN